MSGPAGNRHLEILRQFNFPEALAHQCMASNHPSGNCIFIRFPSNKLIQARYNYAAWEVGVDCRKRADKVAGLGAKMAYVSLPLIMLLGLKAPTT